MKPFSSMTTQGQTRRLRNLAIQALQSYPFTVTRLRLLSHETNVLFCIHTQEGDRWVLRINQPEGGHTRDHIAAEVDWLAALSRETSLKVPRPLAAKDGTLFIEAGVVGVPEKRICTIFSWVPGRNLGEHLSLARMVQLGELSARLHAHSCTYQPPAGLNLLSFDRVFPFLEPVILFEEPWVSQFSPAQRLLFRQTIDRVQTAIDQLKAGGESMHILHGDLHPWNVRVSGGALVPIDFEDLMWGWFIQDIATTLYYFQDEADFNARRIAFRQGYERIREYPDPTAGEVDAFIAARGLGLLNYVLNYPESVGLNPLEFATRIEKRLVKLFNTQ
ncbi:MAG TPA: phosphotransferase [Anaerolineaceae bacterium]